MRSTVCAAHTHDALVPVESHHVWPLGYHGPDAKTNRRQLCANAHSDTHYLLELMLKTPDGVVEWEVRRTFGPGVRKVAADGWAKVVAYAEQLAAEQP